MLRRLDVGIVGGRNDQRALGRWTAVGHLENGGKHAPGIQPLAYRTPLVRPRLVYIGHAIAQGIDDFFPLLARQGLFLPLQRPPDVYQFDDP